MASNGAATPNYFNIGQDISVTLQYQPSGATIDSALLGHVMEFEWSATDVDVKVVPISNGGVPLLCWIPAGWTGRMQLTRYNGALLGIIAALEANFFNTGVRALWNISIMVTNGAGTIDRYQLNNVILNKTSGGNFKSDKETDLVFEFRAATITQTDGLGSLIGAAA